jgi:hypothetical protein
MARSVLLGRFQRAAVRLPSEGVPHEQHLHAADVVDGREEFVGSDIRAATAAIARAARLPRPPLRITVSADRGPSDAAISLTTRVDAPAGTSLAGAAEVFVAIAEDGLTTEVRRGENGGKLLSHSAVVRSLASAGTLSPNLPPWSAKTPLPFSPTWNAGRSRGVAFVQDRTSKRILGAAAVNLSPTP